MDFDIPKSAVETYIQRRYTDLEKFKQALTEQDTETFQRIGHQIKGNGVTFGFPRLSELGQKMEQAAQAHSIDKLRTLVSEYEIQLSEASKVVAALDS